MGGRVLVRGVCLLCFGTRVEVFFVCGFVDFVRNGRKTKAEIP